MTITNDFKALGLARDATPAAVRAAWRGLASSLHPDTGGDAAQFDAVRGAYKRALEAARAPRTCLYCHGRGQLFTRSGFGAIPMRCKGCRGSGKIIPE